MDVFNGCAHHRNFTLSTIFSFITFLAFATSCWPQNPNSGLTGTGQVLTVNLVSPADSSLVIGQNQCQTFVQGLVTLSQVEAPAISVLYVIDLSGSTGDPTNFPPMDVNGDGLVDSEDDFNADGSQGDILDAEISATLALNESLGDLAQIKVGVLGYASQAVAADISPAAVVQLFSQSPQTDADANNVPDIEEVLRSLDSDPMFGGSIGKFSPVDQDALGNSTNFEAPLQIALLMLSARPEKEHKVVFFLSDGDNKRGSDISDEIQAAAAAGIVINTLGISTQADPNDLSAIAAGTGGVFIQVNDPSELTAAVASIRPVGIANMQLNGTDIEVGPVGIFSSRVELSGGHSKIQATAFAEDGTEVSADITVVCADTNLSCSIRIVTPVPGTLVCGDTVEVVAVTESIGGIPPLERTCIINGRPVSSVNDTLRAAIPLVSQDSFLLASCTYKDALGNTNTCYDTVAVRRPEIPTCKVEIVAPINGKDICADSVRVTALVHVSVQQPATLHCEINGQPTALAADSSLTALVDLTGVSTVISAHCVAENMCGIQTSCSDSVTIFQPALPNCSANIVSPVQGDVVCGDSVTVVTEFDSTVVADGAAVVCKVNGFLATASGSNFSINVPVPVNGELIAVCTITDSCGSRAVCTDTVQVSRTIPPFCKVKIVEPAPESGVVNCSDSVLVRAEYTISGEAVNEIACSINGLAATRSDSDFFARVPLSSGNNRLIATCAVTDSCGNRAACSDTVKIRYDDRPPYCEFEFENGIISGTFYDPHSGIASIQEVEIRNGMLSVENFHPGAKRVDFLIQPLDPNKHLFFSIDVADMCGNVANCDPVFLNLATASDVRERVFTFYAIDRFLQVDNFGLDKISFQLNGNQFELLANSALAATGFNAFEMPQYGRLTLDLKSFLNETNQMRLHFDGPTGAHARLMLSGQADFVDIVLDLQPLPQDFELRQNYPNPFNPKTQIQFAIPAHLQEGVITNLSVFNLLGARVRVLVDARKSPGHYTVEWDGKNAKGEMVSTGIYIFRLETPDFVRTRRMLFLK